MTSLPARFWAKVNKNGPVPEARPDLGPCWLWIASTYGKIEYGKFFLRYEGDHRVYDSAHRVSYIDTNGPVPVGLELDHLCRVRS